MSRVSVAVGYCCALVILLAVVRTGYCQNKWDTALTFMCPADCERVMCLNTMIDLKKYCKAGTVYDPCGCCQVCAKAESERCGGHMDSYGKCGANLCCTTGQYCSIEPMSSNEIGVCRRIAKRPEPRNSVDTCKPPCTPHFCSKWPDAVCSANKNAIISRTCQQPCQHTVCQACFFKTQREPPCRKCAKDDFECMRKFGKCVKRDTCTRHKFPCEPHQKKKSDGRFICKVPGCLQ